MSYAPILMICALMLMAVAGSSRFVQFIAAQERFARRREEVGHLSHRLARLVDQGRMTDAERLTRQLARMTEGASAPPARRLRLAHAALLLVVVLWPGSSNQAPVRQSAPEVEAAGRPTHERHLPCRYVKATTGRDRRIG